MLKTGELLWFIALMIPLAVAGCAPAQSPATSADGLDYVGRVQVAQEEAAFQLTRLERQHLTLPDNTSFFTDAARVAWQFVERYYRPTTGLTTPLGSYQFATLWDIGSMLGALYSARALELIDDDLYQTRLRKILQTLDTMPLYDGKVFNKSYDTRTAAMVHHDRGLSGKGLGWSAIDLGRLLIWLKIVGRDNAETEKLTEAIVGRNDFSRVVRSGYLWGESVRQEYQEGRIGYEQYAAQGFALWGFRAEDALNLNRNALPLSVMGQTLPADLRRWDRLTSEPFVLMGLELGWDRQTAEVVRRLLLAQERRYQKTGAITIAAEDAVDVEPHFFYYYCLYAGGKHFAIDVQDRRSSVEGPRWVSTKSAFAFHALMPTRYTDLAVQRLRNAQSSGGWASGVYERTDQSTGNLNINTAAVILSAALYDKLGQPLLPSARRLLTSN